MGIDDDAKGPASAGVFRAGLAETPSGAVMAAMTEEGRRVRARASATNLIAL